MNAVPTDASSFLSAHASNFENEAVRAWRWGDDPEDNDFGKSHSWDVVPFSPEHGQTVQVNASVDLQLTQLTLSISERDMSEGPASADTNIVFEALVQFEDRRIVVDGAEREYSTDEIRALIAEFNERTR